MNFAARMTSKGQITVPNPDFLDWAGSVSVPTGKRGTSWDEVLRQRRRARAEKRRGRSS